MAGNLTGPINLQRVGHAHRSLVNDIAQAFMQTDAEMHPFVQRHVRRQPLGFKHRTGGTARATQARAIRNRRGRRIIVSNSARHAASLDRGSRPHIIRAKRGKALRFVANGQVVFRRSVRHPGTKPTNFLRRTTSAAFHHYGQRLRPRLQRAAARFRGAR